MKRVAIILSIAAISVSLLTAQNENRRVATYSSISNIMKSKHDTVKNSISNVR